MDGARAVPLWTVDKYQPKMGLQKSMLAEKEQMRFVAHLLEEIDQEAATTKSLLEVIPEDQLGWRPHPKSMSLGSLGLHIAQSPAQAAQLAQADAIELPEFPPISEPGSVAEILAVFSESLAVAKSIVAQTDDDRVFAEWKMTKDGKTIMAVPRARLWRTLILNHTYHHRGQLSVYLRELDVALPPIYGPSADANPFG